MWSGYSGCRGWCVRVWYFGASGGFGILMRGVGSVPFMWEPGYGMLPGFVRPYVLGHEYAHIYRGHTLLAPMMALSWLVAAILSVFSRRSAVCWFLNFMFFVVAFLASLMFLFLWGTGLGEYTADTMGAKACGDPELALKAALWMAEKNGITRARWPRRSRAPSSASPAWPCRWSSTSTPTSTGPPGWRGIIEEILARKGPEPQLYNLNIPTAALRGRPEVCVVPMNVTRYGDSFEKRTDPWGRDYYWLKGGPPETTPGHETDLSALAKGKVTITPLDYNMTRKAVLAQMEQWQFQLPEIAPKSERGEP